MDHKTVWKRIFLGATTVLGVLLALHLPVVADTVDCTGTMGGEAKDNLRVPRNVTCTLNGTQVKGDITVESNATLYAFNARVGGGIKLDEKAALSAFNVRVEGDVQAQNASQVSIFAGSFVGGSVRVVQAGTADIDGVQIGKDLFLEKNTHSLKASNNTIGGALRAYQNTGRLALINNTVRGGLACRENVFAPTGGGNSIEGALEGQCNQLDRPAPPKEDCCEIK